MNKDTIVGIVGAVILVAAMIGVFKYEGSRAQATLGSKSFDVAWTTKEVTGPTLTSGTALRSSTEEKVTVTESSIVDADFTITWTAQQGEDTLRLTVVPPDGSDLNESSAEGASGSLTVTFTSINEPPSTDRAFGDETKETEERLSAQHAKSRGTGEWTIRVEFLDATGVSGPIPVAPPIAADQEVQWTLATALSVYAPTLTERS